MLQKFLSRAAILSRALAKFARLWYNALGMKVFAVSDLHLSGLMDKPMDVFGPGWEGHFEKIKADWEEKVSDGDVVLIGGDTSWGMYLEEGAFDLKSLAPLKGQKVFVRGNHDFWWNAISHVRASAPDDTFHFLQNDCVKIGKYVIAGSRGWTCPGSADFTEHDMALYLREGERFRLAFKEVQKVRQEGDILIVLIHYPPFNVKLEDTVFTQLFEENKADTVVFGHLHGAGYFPLKCEKNGIGYYLTSCDKLHFRLTQIY